MNKAVTECRAERKREREQQRKKWERELWHDMRKFHSPNQTPIHMWNASEYCETCCAYSFIKKKKRKPSERRREKEFVEAECDLQKKIMLCRSSAHLRLNKPQWIWFSIKLQSNLRTRSKSPGFRCEEPPSSLYHHRRELVATFDFTRAHTHTHILIITKKSKRMNRIEFQSVKIICQTINIVCAYDLRRSSHTQCKAFNIVIELIPLTICAMLMCANGKAVLTFDATSLNSNRSCWIFLYSEQTEEKKSNIFVNVLARSVANRI